MNTMMWLLRRETWEHRALYIAPLITLAILVIGLASDFNDIPMGIRALSEHAPGREGAILGALHLIVAVPFVIVMSIVAAFYCLDALYAERRDRSVLFWKSLPLSDLEVVLSKVAVVVVLVPLITFVAAFVAQIVALIGASLAGLVGGASPALLWTETPIFSNSLLLIYALFVQSFWYLPLYAWILLASAWAPRAATLWAVLPPLGVILLERLVLHTTHFADWLHHRLVGLFPLAFRVGDSRVGIVIDDDTVEVPNRMIEVVDPTAVLTSPGLWTGIAVAAVLIAATVWVRRYRDPD
jgi:ABC-2 type transport system permease protein